VVLLAAPGGAWAFDDAKPGLYLEGGVAPHGAGDTGSVSVGVQLPWLPERRLLDAAPTPLYLDVFASNWHAPAQGGGFSNFAQVGALAVLRYRLDQTRSPWFVEAGVGGSLTDRIYHSSARSFSTAFQFTEALGVGYSFDEFGQAEVSLRVQHFSNGNIKQPNPGETFVRLRGAYHF